VKNSNHVEWRDQVKTGTNEGVSFEIGVFPDLLTKNNSKSLELLRCQKSIFYSVVRQWNYSSLKNSFPHFVLIHLHECTNANKKDKGN